MISVKVVRQSCILEFLISDAWDKKCKLNFTIEDRLKTFVSIYRVN